MISKHVTFQQKNVNILFMRNDLSVPTLIGAVVALGSFTATMSSLLNDSFPENGYQIVWAFLILGPIAMASCMLGYAAWWFSKFISALVSKPDDSGSDRVDRPQDQ
jgi:hypothetical protein